MGMACVGCGAIASYFRGTGCEAAARFAFKLVFDAIFFTLGTQDNAAAKSFVQRLTARHLALDAASSQHLKVGRLWCAGAVLCKRWPAWPT